MFGGSAGQGTFFNDVWELHSASWEWQYWDCTGQSYKSCQLWLASASMFSSPWIVFLEASSHRAYADGTACFQAMCPYVGLPLSVLLAYCCL